MKQREPRQPVSLPARVRWEGHWLAASVRNISKFGLMVRLSAPPEPGTYVEVRIGEVVVAARTVWSEGEFCGMRSGAQFDLGGIGKGRGPGSIGLVRQSPRVAVPSFRSPNHAELAERSRWLGSMIQHVTFVAIALCAASGIAWEIYQTISAPTAALNQTLEFRAPRQDG